MAVVAEFEGTPLVGSPDSFQVQFTNQSTGGVDRWWWDFGDGQVSEEQNPLHTYEGSYGDSFTVSLKAMKSGGHTEINHGQQNQYKHWQKGSATFGNTALVWAYLNDTAVWIQFFTVGTLTSFYVFDGTGVDEEAPTYNGGVSKPTMNLVLPAPSGAGDSAYRLIFTNWSDVSMQFGIINLSTGGRYDAALGSGQFVDVTGLSGDIEFIPDEAWIPLVPPQAPFAKAGAGCRVQLLEQPTGAADDIDVQTKPNYISFGVPPVADFTGSPLSGSNPVEVQFENLSTPAIGQATNYSWKKRKSGSGDSFVEFSTEFAPLHNFGK